MARLRDNPRRPGVNDVLPPDLWATRAHTPDGERILPAPAEHGPPWVPPKWVPGEHERNQAAAYTVEQMGVWAHKLIAWNYTSSLFGELTFTGNNPHAHALEVIGRVADGCADALDDLCSWFPTTTTYDWWRHMGPIVVCVDGRDLKVGEVAGTLGYSEPWGSWARTTGKLPGKYTPRQMVRDMLATHGGQRRR